MVGRLLFFCGSTFPRVMLNFRHKIAWKQPSQFWRLLSTPPFWSNFIDSPVSPIFTENLASFPGNVAWVGVLLLPSLRLYVNLYTDCHAFLPKKMCHKGCQVDEVYTAPMKSFSEFGWSTSMFEWDWSVERCFAGQNDWFHVQTFFVFLCEKKWGSELTTLQVSFLQLPDMAVFMFAGVW